MTMRLLPARNSSQIAHLAFDDDTSVLIASFHSGETYSYFGITESLVQELLNAPSLGTAFNIKVKKGGFQWNRVTGSNPLDNLIHQKDKRLETILSMLPTGMYAW